jgi:predicted RNase H-like HicB family nuclease
MNRPVLAFTAVFLKSNGGYFAFVEELPTVNAYGRTLDEARESLYKLTALALSDDALEGTGVLRENLTLPLPAPRRRRARAAA